MNLNSAALIRARTMNNDFPYGFLVKPENFRTADVNWARQYVVESTRYFELASSEGRRVVFCNEKYIVYGISIGIEDLYKQCLKTPRYQFVEEGRKNYAFIGFVFRKNEVTEGFDIPFESFLEIYESYMDKLWDISNGEESSLEDTTFSIYMERDFPVHRVSPEDEFITGFDQKVVIDARIMPVEDIISYVIQQMKHEKTYAFCSDLPNTTSVVNSDFDVVSSYHSDVILADMKKNLEKELKEKQTKNSHTTEEKNIQFLDRIKTIANKNNRTNKQMVSSSEKNDTVRVIRRCLSFLVIMVGGLIILINNKDMD